MVINKDRAYQWDEEDDWDIFDSSTEINVNKKYKMDKKNKFLDLDIKKIKFTQDGIKNKFIFSDIKSFMDMNDSYEAYLGAYSEAEFFAYRYLKVHKVYPSLVTIPNIKTNVLIEKLSKTFDIPTTSYYKSISYDAEGIYLNTMVFALKDNGNPFYLYLTNDEATVLFDNSNKEIEGVKTLLGLIKGIVEPKVVQNKIYVVYQTSGGFEKTGFKVKKVKVDLDDNYNDGFENISKTLIDGLNSKDKTNLVLLSGDPGTGKCVIGKTKITVRNKKTGIIEELNIEDLM